MKDPGNARILDLLREALALPEQHRGAFLDERCAGDSTLRSAIEELLVHDADPLHTLEPERVAPRVEGFRIEREIGRGSTGVVFEAWQEAPGRPVALKVLHPAFATPEVLRRFRDEAKLLGRIDHPHVARVFTSGTADSQVGRMPWIAMELVGGEPVTRAADERGLGLTERVEILALVAEAVHHAHLRGVLHRDLKPANVLLDGAGKPRVLDFGVARALDADEGRTLRTRAGDLVGTVAYMSPEQAGGNPADLDVRSDVYALGVLGYELLTGRLPHDTGAAALGESLRRVREDDPVPAGRWNRDVRGDLELILATAMAKDRGRRYGSAADFAGDLRRLLRHEPIAARPPTALYQLRKLACRHPGLTAGLVVAMCALLLVAVATTRFGLREARLHADANFEAYRGHVVAAHASLRAGDVATAARRVEDAAEFADGWELGYLRWCLDESAACLELGAPASGLAVTADGSYALVALDEPVQGARTVLVGLPELGVKERIGEADAPVAAVAIDSAGTRVAVCDSVGGLSVRDGTGTLLWRAEVPAPGENLHLAFEPGGERLAYGGRHAGLGIVEPAGDARTFEVMGSIGGLLWTEDGILSTVGHELRQFPPDGAARLLARLDQELLGLARNPLDDRLAVGSRDRSVRILEPDGTLGDQGAGHEGEPVHVCWSPDGTSLASGGEDRTVRITSPAGNLVLSGHGGMLRGLAWPPGVPGPVSVSQDGTLRLWDVGGTARREVLRTLESFAYAVAISPDGGLVAIGDFGGEVVLLGPDGSTRWSVRLGHPIEGLAFAGAERLAVALGSKGVVELDPGQGRVIRNALEDPPAPVLAVAPDEETGALVAVLSGEGLAVLRGREVVWCPVPEARGVAVDPEADRYACTTRSGGVVLFDSQGNEQARMGIEVQENPSWYYSLGAAFAPDGRHLAAGTETGEILVWDLEGERVVHRLAGHSGRVFDLVYTPDGARILSAADDPRLRVWDTGRGVELLALEGHGHYVKSLAMDPASGRLLSASGDRVVRIWGHADAVPAAPRDP